MPISFARAATLYASRPYKPTAANASASRPSPLASVVTNRSRTDAESTCALSERISTGDPGIRGCSSRRIASVSWLRSIRRFEPAELLKFCDMTCTWKYGT